MSRDIRSYFSMGAATKKPKIANSPVKRKSSVISLSDSDEEVPDTPPVPKKSGITSKKRRRVIEDEKEEAPKMKEKKLKEVDPASFFGNQPIKRVEKSVKEKKNDDLFDSDGDLELSMIEIEKVKTPVKEKKKENKTPEKKETPKKVGTVEKEKPKHTSPKRNLNKSLDNEKPSSSKVSKHETPKNIKKRKKSDAHEEITDEVRHERRVQAARLYKEHQNRKGPPHPGSKEIPEGKKDCLSGLKFIITGELDSQTREEAVDLIKSLGGRMMTTVSKQLSYMIVGVEGVGPKKLALAEEHGTKQIDEDEFLDLIRERSGIPKLKKSVKECEEKSPKKMKKEEKFEENSPKNPKKETHETKKPVNVKKTPEKPKIPIKIEEKLSFETKVEPIHVENIAWVDKYKPSNVKQIIGQQGPASNCQKLINWLQKWDSNNDGTKKHARPNPWAKNDDGSSFKAVLLSGPPGVGKTTTAHLVCKELGYDIVEFNASDTRSKRLLQEQVSSLLSNKSLNAYAHGHSSKTTKKRVLIMDEVDGIGGNEDRGGTQELIQLIKTTGVPVICMCNDRNHPKIRSLVNYCYDLRFNKPRVDQIRAAMMSVLFKEGMKIPRECLDEIISGTGNDVRQTLNHLAMYSASKDTNSTKSEEYKKVAKTAEKDVKIGPFDVTRKIFSVDEHKHFSIDDKLSLFFHDYSMTPLFVQENYLSVNVTAPPAKHLELFAEAADSLSRGDMVERRIRTNNAWTLLPVQGMLTSVIPGDLLEGHCSRINFPEWLGKNSKTNKRKRLAQEIHDHTRTCTSGSRLSVRLDYAQFLTKAIIDPLKQKGMEGVNESLDVIKAYKLLREDIDSLIELSMWPDEKNPMEGVESKVKAALTRTYNKEVLPYSYSVQQAVKKKKVEVSEEYEGYGAEDEGLQDASGSEEEDDKLENNAFIKVKKPSAVAPKKTGSSKEKAGSSKDKAGSSKEKGGKGKKK